MTLSQWFIFFLIVQLVHGLGTWKLYIKSIVNFDLLIGILGHSEFKRFFKRGDHTNVFRESFSRRSDTNDCGY